jgi:hypothetical protein
MAGLCPLPARNGPTRATIRTPADARRLCDRYWCLAMDAPSHGPKLEMSNVHDRPRSMCDRLTYWLLLTAGIPCQVEVDQMHWHKAGEQVLTEPRSLSEGLCKTSPLIVLISCCIGSRFVLIWNLICHSEVRTQTEGRIRSSTLCRLVVWFCYVYVAAGYGLDGRGWVLDRNKNSTQPPVQCVPLNLAVGVKRQERQTDHYVSPIAEVKTGGAIPPFPHMFSLRGA